MRQAIRYPSVRPARRRSLVTAVARARRSSSRGPSTIPPPASTTTSRRPPASGTRPPTCRSPASRSASSARTIDFKNDLGLTDTRFRELHVVLRPARKHKFRFQYIPIKYEQRATIDARHRLQRPALPRRPPGQLAARLEGLPVRLRVRLHRRGTAGSSASSSTSSTPTCAAVAREPGSAVDEFAHAQGADSRDRRHRPRLRRPERLDHRRAHRHQGAGEHHRGLQGPLHRPRHLRHRELHQQRRRAGRLPIASTSATRSRTTSATFKLKGLYFGIVARY